MPEATLRLTWAGHATALVEMDGVRLLTDPVVRGRLAHLRRHAPPVAPELTSRIDAVLISHLHSDHLDFPSLRRLAPQTVAVTAVPATHDGRRWPLGRAAGAVGFVLSGAQRVYFAGDTDVFDAMRDIGGGLDLALLPVWGWGPSLGPGHMDPPAAARAAALLRPRVAVPIHWGTLFPVGLANRHRELLVDPPHEFARHVAELAPDVRVEILAPGGVLELATPVER